MPWQGELADYHQQYGGSGIAGPRRILRKRVEKDEIAQVLRANVNFSARVLQDTFQDGSHHQHLGKTDDVGHHAPAAGSFGSPSTSSRTQHVRGNSSSRGSARESEFRGSSQHQEDNTGFVVSDRFVETTSDIQKLDEWLKHPTDSLSSIEFDGDIKTIEEDYEFVVRLDGEGDTPLGDPSVGPALLFESSTIKSTLIGTDRPRPSIQSSTLQRGHSGVDCVGGDSVIVEDLLANCSDSTPSVSFRRGLPGSDLKDFAVVRSVCGDEAEFALAEADGRDGGSMTDATQLNTDMSHHPLGQLNFAETNSMDIMLMTPQELERMPESGIEFEESVGPKESEPLLPSDAVEVALHVTDDCMPEEETMESAELGPERVKLMLEPHEAGPDQLDAVVKSEQISVEPEISYVDDSATLATISISTDADSNTTSFIISTEQGQKAFRVNTNNLLQAAAAANLQPVTLADLVNEQGITVLGGDDVEQVNQVEGKEDHSEHLREGDLEYSTDTVTYPRANCLQEEKCTGTVCTHTGRCKMTWTCPEPHCGKVYTKQCKLKVHMMSHTGIRPHKCTVEGCDWSFTTVYKLKRHLETHGGSKDFVCDFDGCNSKFTTIYNLNSHMKLHTQPNAVPCSIEYCDCRFPNRRKMELHLREHKEVEAPYTCPEETCGKKYYTANSMASHLRCHQKTSFPCTFENCDMVFDKFSRFKTHLWRHTDERPYVCTHEGCGWAFPSASKRKRHMQKHTGERHYTCSEPGCGKSFRRLEHMQGHAITHSGKKPFGCPHPNCGASFTARSSLYVHIKKHAGSDEKLVYPCPVENCTKKYNCKSSLRMHMLKYHTPILDAGQLDYVTWLSSEEFQDCGDGQTSDGVVPQAVNEAVAVDGESDGVYENEAEEIQMEFVTTDDVDCPVVTSDATSSTTTVVAAVAASADIPLDVGAQMVVAELPHIPDVSMDLISVSPQHPLEVESTDVVDAPSTSGAIINDLDSLSSSRVLQQNHSGSARTDFCSNHKTIDGMRRRKQLLEERGNVETLLSTSEVVRQRGRQLKINNVRSLVFDARTPDCDVIRMSAAAASQYGCMSQSQLLQDDPPSHGDQFYQDDGLLTSMANDLAVPISLLTEVSVVDPSTVSEFTGTTINLQDLE